MATRARPPEPWYVTISDSAADKFAAMNFENALLNVVGLGRQTVPATKLPFPGPVYSRLSLSPHTTQFPDRCPWALHYIGHIGRYCSA